MSLRLSDHKVVITQHRIPSHRIASHHIASFQFFFLHNIAFFQFCLDFLAFFTRITYLKFLEFWEFNKTILFHSFFVGYETGYSQLGATRLIGYLPPHIQQATMK